MDVLSNEGHLKWLHELAPYIEKAAKMEEESLESYLKKVLKGNKTETPANGEGLNEWSINLARTLNTVAMSILTGYTENARLFLERIDELVDNQDEATDMQRQVIWYCRDVLKNYVLEDRKEGQTTNLNQRWEELINVGGDEVKATISFLKGMLGLHLQIEMEKVNDFIIEANRLDTSCLAWYHHAYRSVRRIRIKRKHGQNPSKMEIHLAKTAYQLCDGQNLVAATDYGVMLKETFKKQNPQFWRDNHDLYLECIEVFEKALPFAQGDLLMKIRIYLAEFLYSGKGRLEENERGRKMFSELEQDYPKSLAVLHKVGNLYRDERKFVRARECYKRALEVEPTVVSCIMDYLKLLKSDKDQAEIVRVLKKSLSPEYVRSNEDHAKLQRELELAIGRSSVADLDDNWRRK